MRHKCLCLKILGKLELSLFWILETLSLTAISQILKIKINDIDFNVKKQFEKASNFEFLDSAVNVQHQKSLDIYIMDLILICTIRIEKCY